MLFLAGIPANLLRFRPASVGVDNHSDPTKPPPRERGLKISRNKWRLHTITCKNQALRHCSLALIESPLGTTTVLFGILLPLVYNDPNSKVVEMVYGLGSSVIFFTKFCKLFCSDSPPLATKSTNQGVVVVTHHFSGRARSLFHHEKNVFNIVMYWQAPKGVFSITCLFIS